MEKETRMKHKRPANRIKRPAKQMKLPTVEYIVVHSTGTRADIMSATDIVRQHRSYHFLITPHGMLLNAKPIGDSEQRIEIAWQGGLDNNGFRVDNRTGQQNETLFTTLVLLTEYFPDAQVVAANDLYPYGFNNPGFDVKKWLRTYMPAIVFDAA